MLNVRGAAKGVTNSNKLVVTELRSKLQLARDFQQVREVFLSPFLDKSPVKFLKDFYNNARHLDDELAMSSIGRLLGAAELGGTAKDQEILA